MVPVRATELADVPALTALLNDIIARGGTTALQSPVSEAYFAGHYVNAAEAWMCHTALDGSGQPCAFQAVLKWDALPDGWGDIGTWARQVDPIKGAGTALFAATQARCRELGLTHLNATIRADNVPGLAYYAKMGFVDYAIRKAVPLEDGTPVDRISRQFVL